MSMYTHTEKDKMVRLEAESDFHERIAMVRGEAFRAYRRRWELAGRFELETRVPLHVDFELSTSCNYRCPMCPFGMPKESRPPSFDAVKGRFPIDLFRRVIDEGVPRGLCAVDLSYFNEPLLRRDLMDFVDYATDHGVLDIMFSTNGELLSPPLTERLLDSGLTRFMVSLDAHSEETFREIRVGGDYHKVVGNLEHFLRRKRERGQVLPVTRVSFVRTKLNEHEVEAFLEYWRPLVDYVCVQELLELDGMSSLTPTTIRTNLDFRCHMPWHRLTIRANGDALPCCTIYGQELVMGNVARQPLEEIWTSPAMRQLRLLHREGRYAENPICRVCARNSVAR